MAEHVGAPDATADAPGVGDSVLITGLVAAEALWLNGQFGIMTKQANARGRVEVTVTGSRFRMLPANARRLAFGIGTRVEARSVDSEEGWAVDGRVGTVVGYTLASDRYQVYFLQGGMADLRATSLSFAGPSALARVAPQDGPGAQDATGSPAPAAEETAAAAAGGEPAPASEEPLRAAGAGAAAAATPPAKRARTTTDSRDEACLAPAAVVIEDEPEAKPPAKRGRRATLNGQAARPAQKPEAPSEQADEAGAKPNASPEGSSPTTPTLKQKAAARSAGSVDAEGKAQSPAAREDATPATKPRRGAEEKAQSPAAAEAPAERRRPRGRPPKAAAGDGASAARGECGAGEPPGAVAKALESSGAWRKAVRKGMEGRLLNLASRGDVSKRGFGPDELLGALLTAGGLVNKAKDALLETAEA